MIVETTRPGARAAEPQSLLPGVEGPIALRALLGELVADEWAGYVARRAESEVLRVLTPADLVRGASSGRYASEVRETPAPPSAEVARERAIEAFGDGLFFVFVDDVRITELDQVLLVDAQTRIRLVRLVALTGG